MELLTTLGPEQCEAALPTLKLSEGLADSLPGSQIQGQLLKDQDGIRLILSLDWDRGSKSEPLSLVGWLDLNPMKNSRDERNSNDEAKQ